MFTLFEPTRDIAGFGGQSLNLPALLVHRAGNFIRNGRVNGQQFRLQAAFQMAEEFAAHGRPAHRHHQGDSDVQKHQDGQDGNDRQDEIAKSEAVQAAYLGKVR